MSRKPVIAVTGPESGGFAPWLMSRLAIYCAGGLALRVHAGNFNDHLCFDGLVLGGGSDISPEHYVSELIDTKDRFGQPGTLLQWLSDLLILFLRLAFSVKLRQPEQDPERDRMEKKLVRKAMDRDLPVLGICRGEQMLNIALGGSLHQNTREFYTESPDIQSIRPVKEIDIKANSNLAAVLNTERVKVNALHSQAVDRLGEGLAVCALDKNGIVQAIEIPERDFVIGVQWHPEYLPGHRSSRTLFRTLVFAANKRKRSNEN